MARNVKHTSEQSTEDGVPGGLINVIMLVDEITIVNSIPNPGDGVTLKSANFNIIGDEFTVVNDSNSVGPGGPLNVFTSGVDTINGVAGPFVINFISPAVGATVTFKCAGLGQWWITSLV